jgi:omega-amidase
MQNLRIVLVQTDLHWENSKANLAMFSEKINALAAPVDLIVLPEMFSTGFSMQAEPLAEKIDGEAVQWMQKTTKEKNCVIVGSLMVSEEENFFNRLIWMRPDGTLAKYDKRHLFSLSAEPTVYTSGEARLVVELNGWRICPLVCYDLRFPVWSRNVAPHYDVLLYVANWPERRNVAWKRLLQARAIENLSYTIGVNRVGYDGANVYHSGDSAVISPLGETLFERAKEECVETVILDYSAVQATRKQLPFLNDADEFILTKT